MANDEMYKELSVFLKSRQEDILDIWFQHLLSSGKKLVNVMGEDEAKSSMRKIFGEFATAMATGSDMESEPYGHIREILKNISIEGVTKGLSPSETAIYVFSVKDAILPILMAEYRTEQVTEIISIVNGLLDRLGLYAFGAYLETRETVIREQQKALLEVSAPVVSVWDGILMVPIIGLLDSSRTQFVMETLLDRIEMTQAKVAILDISGIPAVDSIVAKYLISTASAVRLMGAECIITGISSIISQTMVQVGIDLSDVTTKGTLSDGLRVAFNITGMKVVPK